MAHTRNTFFSTECSERDGFPNHWDSFLDVFGAGIEERPPFSPGSSLGEGGLGAMFLAGWTRPGCGNGELTQQTGRLERESQGRHPAGTRALESRCLWVQVHGCSSQRLAAQHGMPPAIVPGWGQAYPVSRDVAQENCFSFDPSVRLGSVSTPVPWLICWCTLPTASVHW